MPIVKGEDSLVLSLILPSAPKTPIWSRFGVMTVTKMSPLERSSKQNRILLDHQSKPVFD